MAIVQCETGLIQIVVGANSVMPDGCEPSEKPKWEICQTLTAKLHQYAKYVDIFTGFGVILMLQTQMEGGSIETRVIIDPPNGSTNSEGKPKVILIQIPSCTLS